uniref:Uncharacterized protein n=1 Tax=candidate division CPR3 bacterium TaxID=2268181 RepID=A0A7C4M1U8_UNCC3
MINVLSNPADLIRVINELGDYFNGEKEKDGSEDKSWSGLVIVNSKVVWYNREGNKRLDEKDNHLTIVLGKSNHNSCGEICYLSPCELILNIVKSPLCVPSAFRKNIFIHNCGEKCFYTIEDEDRKKYLFYQFSDKPYLFDIKKLILGK